MLPLVDGQIYHVINRGSGSQPVFLSKRDYQRFLETFLYYQNKNLPLKYSRFLTLSSNQRQEILNELMKKKKFLVEILAYCLMSNHVHLLLKQVGDKGISLFMSNLTNSYTRYFNTKNERKGSLFQGKFKAVLVESDEQLLHVSRYIHLNPYTSYVVKNLKETANYPYSSFEEYLNPNLKGFCEKEIILSNFKSGSKYKEFVFDQADYQRRLEQLKNLQLES